MPPRPRLRPPAPLAPRPLPRTFAVTRSHQLRERSPHGSVPSPAPPPDPSPPPTPDLPQLIITSDESGPSPPKPTPAPTPQVPFSTQAFIRKLERRSGGTMGRAVATVIMQATRDRLQEEERRVGLEAWRKGDLENEAYLYTAALAELKTSSQVRSRNDSTVLRSMTASLQRETDAVEQRLNEDMHRLRSDIQLDQHSRKEEVNADLKGLDRAIMELNGKFTILLGEARTEIETVRWVSTRRVMSASPHPFHPLPADLKVLKGTLVLLVVLVVAAVSYSPSPAADTLDPNAPTVEELGVTRTEGTEADVTGGRGWFWGVGRVEGEGEEGEAADAK